MVIVGSVLMVASGTVFVSVKVMFDKINTAVGEKCLLGDCDAEPGGDIKGPLDFLLVGSDMRDGWSAAQSDSIMILHINENLTNAQIVAIPRDLYVPIVGTDCGGGQSCRNKINAAFAQGGKDPEKSITSLAKTLTELTGVDFEGAGMINFGGFTDLVDTLGGVELCLPFEMEVRHSKNEKYPPGPNKGRIFPKGCKEYGKKDVLPIVRERYAYGPKTPGWTEEWGVSDYGRQRMQQHFIKQLLKKAKAEGYISDPTKVGTLIEGIGDQVLLDLRGHSVVDFAFALRGIKADRLATLRVPSGTQDTDVGDSVVIKPGEQEQAAEALFSAMRDDELGNWAEDYPDWVNSGT
ncbi:LCP family protein [Stackebrandtia nassauensis]|uniref:Cell envelope-related transcriptional attenuator n=1 Tax=Stackebrandtia nassauensis (strain DSM 44728 / CIP 108903 / NRRL B-16338 / NBRC 102104 / LLR-40K-21) TaxID=446470 RepID=D3Q944_STANL|nr:LCP family protein [Stackebrandtia nassauensis]ADD40653.1 cell envelope-related transcriptional attenuator [Stackebrandtia nassauensis DSM 44728]